MAPRVQTLKTSQRPCQRELPSPRTFGLSVRSADSSGFRPPSLARGRQAENHASVEGKACTLPLRIAETRPAYDQRAMAAIQDHCVRDGRRRSFDPFAGTHAVLTAARRRVGGGNTTDRWASLSSTPRYLHTTAERAAMTARRAEANVFGERKLLQQSIAFLERAYPKNQQVTDDLRVDFT